MSVDTSKPATAAEFEAAGVDPAQAAWAAAAHEAQMGRGDALAPILRTEPTQRAAGDAATAQARLDQITNDRAAGKIADYQWRELAKAGGELEQLTNRIASGSSADLSHLEHIFQPPANAWDYRIPPSVGTVTDEAQAADSAFTQMLHAERLPLDLGNALMADIARGRASQKDEPTLAELRPWADQLRAARENPRLRPFVEGASPDQLLAMLSRETAAALVPWARFRASRR